MNSSAAEFAASANVRSKPDKGPYAQSRIAGRWAPRDYSPKEGDALCDLATLALAIDLDGHTFVLRRLLQRLERKEITVAQAVALLMRSSDDSSIQKDGADAVP